MRVIANHFFTDEYRNLKKEINEKGLVSTMFDRSVGALDLSKKIEGVGKNFMSLIKELFTDNPDPEKVFESFVGTAANIMGSMKEVINLKENSPSPLEFILEPGKSIASEVGHKLFENIPDEEIKLLKSTINPISDIISAVQNDLNGYDGSKGLNNGEAIGKQVKAKIDMQPGQNFAQKTKNTTNTLALMTTFTRIGYKLTHDNGNDEALMARENMSEIQKMAVDYNSIKGFCDTLKIVTGFISPFLSKIPLFSTVADKVIDLIPELFLQQQVNGGLATPEKMDKVANLKNNVEFSDESRQFFTDMGKGFKEIGQFTKNGVKKLGQAIKNDVEWSDEAKCVGKGVKKFVKKGVEKTGQAVKNGVKNLGQAIKNNVEVSNELKPASGLTSDTLESTKTAFEEAKTALKEAYANCDKQAVLNAEENLRAAEEAYNKARGINNNEKATNIVDVQFSPVSEGPRFRGM